MIDTPEATRSAIAVPGRHRRGWSVAAMAGGLALIVGVVAACGTSAASGNPVAADTSASSAPASGQGGAGGAGQRGPRSAASGTIAAVQSGTMQVQSTSSQTTVNYSDSTTFTDSETVDLSAVTAGSCITAAAIPVAGAAASSGASSAAPSTSAAPTTSGSASDQSGPFTATIVQLRDPVNGACTAPAGFGGAPGAVSSGAASSGAVPSGAMPSDAAPSGAAPSGGARPSGQPGFGGPGGGFGQRASGTVASVSDDVITVTVTDPSTSQTVQRAVSVTAATVYSKTATAASDALQVGKCAVVQGSADSKGAVTATSIAVSTPAAGATCNTGTGVARGGRTGPRGTRGATAPTGTTGS